ncbi:ATP-binding protein [Natrarchaeobaculum aegyptiacum]|uniref:AAA family ATPase n=1 Tax=Natrarchaeobaculum aegyptiacum TaxID=745377 RepID=A0A2Z2HVJ6_9EURY|nr:ATP-binding protein [Natrarchaeobaculum aegyptiacum]ARS90205.1 AAA family ATPase [Natrarchaeobaculum aegyptiacum]
MTGPFPFAAMVGQDELKRALTVNAVAPDIGGVLLYGEKGTGKSTAVRAFSEVLPEQAVVTDCPFGCDPSSATDLCDRCRSRQKCGEQLQTETRAVRVVDLPLNATADRLVGTLDVERAVTDGIRQFDPGILAEANRNVLYVDEVNLLDDHLVDVLLDAAAMGENVVEREGVSVRHPAEFMLVGTMNPEEGSLRPQLLDRFGLVVDVAGIDDVDQRVEISRRRAAFDADPETVRAEYADQQRELTQRIVAARERLPDVTVPQPIEDDISNAAVDGNVAGLRGDITVRKTARAIAALEGEETVTTAHCEEAMSLALPHRMQSVEETGGSTSATMTLPEEVTREADDGQSDSEEGTDGQVPNNSGRSELIVEDGEVYPIDDTAFTLEKDRELRDRYARRVPSDVRRRSGRYVRAQDDETVDDIAVDATVRAAALNQEYREANEDRSIVVEPEDLRQKLREGTTEALVVLVVDSSGSVMNGPQMRETKRAVLSLLEDAYRTRDKVAVISFRGKDASVEVAPTYNVRRARRRVSRLRVGGNTPLSHGLVDAYRLIERERRGNDDLYPVVLVLSDGKVNVPYENGADPEQEAVQFASLFDEEDVSAVYLDTGFALNDAKYSLWSDSAARDAKREEYEWNRTLADAMDAEYVPLIDLPDGNFIQP